MQHQDSATIAQHTTEDFVLDLIRDRTERGRVFYQEHASEFVEIATGIVRVPSRSGRGFYDVDRQREECQCLDYVHPTGQHNIGCAHIFGVAIAAAHRRAVRRAVPCDGCVGRFRHADLLEVGEEQASMSMSAREGMRYCPSCARSHDVL